MPRSADDQTATGSKFSDLRLSTTTWYLIVAGEGDAPTSRVVPIGDGSQVRFGRQDECEVSIPHGSVSRRHACIKRLGDHVIVEDLGSRHGTRVNGTAITTARQLATGDVIGIGPITAIVATSSFVRRTRQIATAVEFEDRLVAEIARAVRYQRSLGMLMLRFSGEAEMITEHVLHLQGSLRQMDLLAEYGPEEFAILLPEANLAATTAVAARSQDVAAGLTASVGMATFPYDGSHIGKMIGVARERLRGVGRSVKADLVPESSVVAIDPLMKQVMGLATRVASSPITVLVIGETGSGKEVVAEAIHRASPRRAGPFVCLNCASLSEDLVESELFGHDKGAFTGAIAAKPGFFETAKSGTLFLDEVGELPLSTQAKLLRVLEHRRVARVGSTRDAAIDVRLICATNRDLEAEVGRGRFRKDLYFRISAFVIPVPPLRDRRTEIAPLASHFARECSSGTRVTTVGPEAIAVLEAHDWPGNVRELRNTIERAVVLSGGARIEPVHLPGLERFVVAPGRGPEIDVRHRVAEIERAAVAAALAETKGNQTRAARKLGVSRFALIRMVEKYQLKKR